MTQAGSIETAITFSHLTVNYLNVSAHVMKQSKAANKEHTCIIPFQFVHETCDANDLPARDQLFA